MARFRTLFSPGGTGLLRRGAAWLSVIAERQFDTAGAAAATVTPAAAAQSHASTSPTIAALSVVTPANAAEAHASTSPTIATVSPVTPAAGAQGHAATSPTIATLNAVAPANAAQSHSATASTVTIPFKTPILFANSGTSPSTSAVRYSGLVGSSAGPLSWETTSNAASSPIAVAGTLSNLRVYLPVALTGAQSWTFDIYINGVPSAVTCTVTSAGLSAFDGTNTVAVVAGDKVSIRSSPTGSPPSQSWLLFSFTHTATQATQGLLFAGAVGSVVSGTPTYGIPGKYVGSAATLANNTAVMPCAGTISTLYHNLEAAPGAGLSRTATITKNGVDTALTVALTDAATSGSITVTPVSYAAGDTISIRYDTTTTVASNVQVGLDWTPSVAGEVPILATQNSALSTTATHYGNIIGGSTGSVTNETLIPSIAPIALTVKAFRQDVNAPGTGKSRTATLRQNYTDTAAVADVIGAATTATWTGSLAIAAGDLLSAQNVPTGTPAISGSVKYGTVVTATPGQPTANPLNAAQAHSSTSPTVAAFSAVAPAAAAQSHASTSPTIAAASAVAPANAAQDHASTAPTVAALSAIAPANATEAHEATTATLSIGNINPDAATQAHSSTAPTIATLSTVAPAGAAQGHTATSPTVAVISAIVPANAAQSHSSTSPTIAPKSTVAPANGAQGHASTAPTITTQATIVAANSAQSHASTSPTIAPKSAVTPANGLQSHAATTPTASLPVYGFNISGGTVTTDATYRYWTFLASDTPTILSGGVADYLVVGGGGSGGNSTASAGGGGAGEPLTGSRTFVSGSITITVGAGGIGDSNDGNPGGASSIGSLVVAEGGAGGGAPTADAASGASGGGGAANGTNARLGGAGTKGNRGGNAFLGDATNTTWAAGGGGGAGGAGQDASSGAGGDGGNGVTIWGNAYAGGGGGTRGNGGTYQGVGKAGGGDATATGSDAVPNSGSGGGGVRSSAGPGGTGGSGKVIFRAPLVPSIIQPVMLAGSTQGISNINNRYLLFSGGPAAGLTGQPSFTGAASPFPVAGTISRLMVRFPTPLSAGQSWIAEVFINSGATGVTCTVDSSSQVASDLTHSIAVAAGDRVTIKMSPVGAPNAQPTYEASFLFTSTTPSGALFASAAGSIVSGTPTYTTFNRHATATTTIANATGIMPCGGSTSTIYYSTEVAPGAGLTRTATLVKNGVDTALSVTISGTATQATATASPVSWVAGDQVYIRLDTTTTVGAMQQVSVDWLPTVPGEIPLLGTHLAAQSNSLTSYAAPCGVSAALEQTETNTPVIFPANFKVVAFRYDVNAPGTGKSRTASLRLNYADSVASAPVADLATNAAWSGGLQVASGDLLDIQAIPAGTPATSGVAKYGTVVTSDLSGTDVNPANASHGHASSTPVLSSKSTVAPVNASHGQTATVPTIAAKATIAPANAAHGHAATTSTLAAAGPPPVSVIANSAAQSHASTSPALTFKSSLVPADAAQAQTSASPTIASRSTVAPESASHGHAATAPTVGAANPLYSPDAATQAHTSTSPALTHIPAVPPDNAVQAHTASSPAIDTKNAIAPQSAAQGHAATVASLAPANLFIAVQSGHQTQTATVAAVGPSSFTGVANAAQAHASTAPYINYIRVDSASHGSRRRPRVAAFVL